MKSKGEKDDPRVPAGVTGWADEPQTTNELEDTEVQVWLGAGELKTPRGHVGGAVDMTIQEPQKQIWTPG